MQPDPVLRALNENVLLGDILEESRRSGYLRVHLKALARYVHNLKLVLDNFENSEHVHTAAATFKDSTARDFSETDRMLRSLEPLIVMYDEGVRAHNTGELEACWPDLVDPTLGNELAIQLATLTGEQAGDVTESDDWPELIG